MSIKTWSNPAGGNWSDDANWIGGAPGTTDYGLFDTTIATPYLVTITGTIENNFYLEDPLATLAIAPGARIDGGIGGGYGIITGDSGPILDGGLLTRSWFFSPANIIGNSGTISLNIFGKGLNTGTSGVLYVSSNDYSDPTVAGTVPFNINGGEVALRLLPLSQVELPIVRIGGAVIFAA